MTPERSTAASRATCATSHKYARLLARMDRCPLMMPIRRLGNALQRTPTNQSPQKGSQASTAAEVSGVHCPIHIYFGVRHHDGGGENGGGRKSRIFATGCDTFRRRGRRPAGTRLQDTSPCPIYHAKHIDSSASGHTKSGDHQRVEKMRFDAAARCPPASGFFVCVFERPDSLPFGGSGKKSAHNTALTHVRRCAV